MPIAIHSFFEHSLNKVHVELQQLANEPIKHRITTAAGAYKQLKAICQSVLENAIQDVAITEQMLQKAHEMANVWTESKIYFRSKD